MQTAIAAQWSDRVRWGKPSKTTVFCDGCDRPLFSQRTVVEMLDGSGSCCEQCARENGILVYQA